MEIIGVMIWKSGVVESSTERPNALAGERRIVALETHVAPLAAR